MKAIGPSRLSLTLLLIALLALRTSASVADCNAIATFLRSAGGTVPWTLNSECCGFVQGRRNVTCDLSTRVISLTWGPTPAERASGINTLSGTGSSLSSLAGLTELRILSLVNNTLSGAAPTWIGSLSKLSQLYLTSNSFTSMPDLSALAGTLSILDIGTNSFSGSLFPWIGQLVNLQELWVGRNSFSGSLPANLANLQFLRFFVIQYNRFSGTIPSYVSRWSNLQAFVIRDNQFVGSFPDTSAMYYLAAAIADNNGFTGSVPSFSGNPNLVQLTLSGNQFSGFLPNMFGLTRLRIIDFSNNPSLTGTLDNILPAQINTCYLAGTVTCATTLANVPIQCRIAQAGVQICGSGSQTGTGTTAAAAPAGSTGGKTDGGLFSAAEARRHRSWSSVALMAAGLGGALWAVVGL